MAIQDVVKRIPRSFLPWLVTGLLSLFVLQARAWIAEAKDWKAKIDAHHHHDTEAAVARLEVAVKEVSDRQLDFLKTFYYEVGQWKKAKEIESELARRNGEK